jgi:hypothetical protein
MGQRSIFDPFGAEGVGVDSSPGFALLTRGYYLPALRA